MLINASTGSRTEVSTPPSSETSQTTISKRLSGIRPPPVLIPPISPISGKPTVVFLGEFEEVVIDKSEQSAVKEAKLTDDDDCSEVSTDTDSSDEDDDNTVDYDSDTEATLFANGYFSHE